MSLAISLFNIYCVILIALVGFTYVWARLLHTWCVNIVTHAPYRSVKMAEAADETVNASVADLALRDEEGVEVRFGDLYKDRRAMIVFVRVGRYGPIGVAVVKRKCVSFSSAFSLIRM